MDSKILTLAQDEGPAYWFLNQLAIIKVAASQTANAFCLVEMVSPVGTGSPLHVHRNEDETFFVLDGQLEFISGAERIHCGLGSSIFLPRDIPHGFRVVGDSPAKYLVFATPGGFDRFVMEAGQPATSMTLPVPTSLDLDKLVALAAKFRIEILGPLPE